MGLALVHLEKVPQWVNLPVEVRPDGKVEMAIWEKPLRKFEQRGVLELIRHRLRETGDSRFWRAMRAAAFSRRNPYPTRSFNKRSNVISRFKDRTRSARKQNFEVMTDQQTKGFRPDLYLDIESVHEIKRQACFRHESQKPDSFWPIHEAMHRRRGEECGVKFAEAYFLVEAVKSRPLLPVSFRPRKK